MTAWKRLAAAVLPVVFAAAAGSAHALDKQCGPITELGPKLTAEGQAAFATGKRLSTAEENKELHISQPVAFGLLYYSNNNGSEGYIVKTDVPLENGPTQMCIDHVIGNIRPQDVRTPVSQEKFGEKFPLLADYLNTLAGVNERVLFQADSMKKVGSKYVPDGTIITATANMVSMDNSHKGRGTIFFTAAANGNTSPRYSTDGNNYTKKGLTIFSTSVAVADARKMP